MGRRAEEPLDIDRLLRQFGQQDGFLGSADRARGAPPVASARAARGAAGGGALRHSFSGGGWAGKGGSDALFLRRLLARDGWGRQTRPAIRFGAYVRGHWMRMPPLMLARHLIKKARAGKGLADMPRARP
jgi:hypothetical protein